VSPWTIWTAHLGKAQRFPDRAKRRLIVASVGRVKSPLAKPNLPAQLAQACQNSAKKLAAFSGLYPRRSYSFVVLGSRFLAALLHVLKLSAVFERRGHEGRAHLVRRVPAIEAELGSTFSHHPIDRVGVHARALLLSLAVVM